MGFSRDYCMNGSNPFGLWIKRLRKRHFPHGSKYRTIRGVSRDTYRYRRSAIRNTHLLRYFVCYTAYRDTYREIYSHLAINCLNRGLFWFKYFTGMRYREYRMPRLANLYPRIASHKKPLNLLFFCNFFLHLPSIE